MNFRLPPSPHANLAAGFAAGVLLTTLVFLSIPSPRGTATPPPSEPATTAAEVIEEHPASEAENPFRERRPIEATRFRAKAVTLTKHPVQLGENYWTIAKRYNISVRTLLGANPDMPFTAFMGQTLFVPSANGTLHMVDRGEDLASIAELYEVDEATLRSVNGVSWWRPLKAGDCLFIPDAKPIQMNSDWKEYYEKRGFFGAPFSGWGRGWTSRYGLRKDPFTGEDAHHGGMDFKAPYGTDVFASAAGKVTFVGVNGGYGNLIVIRHNATYTTYYGHLSKMFVTEGQSVRKGQRIGKVGSTGRSTGPHLHFEIRRNGKRIDPLPLI